MFVSHVFQISGRLYIYIFIILDIFEIWPSSTFHIKIFRDENVSKLQIIIHYDIGIFICNLANIYNENYILDGINKETFI